MGDILIVDDERDIRELISDILKDEGFTTRLAGTSDQCMAELNKEPPGLMILDIWLKDSAMDGIDILKHVKRDNPEIPVVIISGHGNIEIAVAAIKQGAYDFIEKPFNIDQLMVVITRAMETSRAPREQPAQTRRGGEQGHDRRKCCVSRPAKPARQSRWLERSGDADRACRILPRGTSTPILTVPMRPLLPSTAPPSKRTGWRKFCLARKDQNAGSNPGSNPGYWSRPMVA